MLLHWCTLQPAGPSNLAAVRFSSPVRLRSIRIFPTDARPFAQCPDIVACTKPDAFFLDVFFNAFVVQTESRDKQRAPNALVPSVVAYAGGQMEFKVDMGLHSTRLMIIKGDFESVSMAIYGDVVSEHQPYVQTNDLQQVNSVDTRPLLPALDPSNAADPTLLAKQLLLLTPDAPPLHLIIRLMLCLKPSNDDWDDPDFPYLFADLNNCIEEFSLERALHVTARPIADDTPPDLIRKFSQCTAAAIGAKSVAQSTLIADILSQVAPQCPDFARILMEHLELERVFDAYRMDYSTVVRLLGAVSNVDIARAFHSNWFFEILRTLQSLSGVDKEMQRALGQLSNRIRGCHILEEALSDSHADFKAAAEMMRELGTEEKSIGIWLGTMVSHQAVISKLAEHPVLPNPQCPPSLFGACAAVSHDDFIAFVRAYIGVGAVLSVYAWSDSVPNVRCRERALGVIRLWQCVDGYREIVNHLLQLRQMVFRLESLIADQNPPTPSLIHVEHILVELANSPTAMLRPALFKCILSLRQPLSHITQEELVAMRRIASVAEQGLPAAIEEIAVFVTQPMDVESLRILRVALAIVEDEYAHAEHPVLQTLWEEGKHGIISHLVDSLMVVSIATKEPFPNSPLSTMSGRFVAELLHTATDLLRNINTLLLTYPLTSRIVRVLSTTTAQLFIYANALEPFRSLSRSLSVAASKARQTCLDLIQSLSVIRPGQTRPTAEIVLRSLLDYATRLNEHDPIRHVSHVYCLIDHTLPPLTSDPDDKAYWVTSIFPSVLPEMRTFLRVLDTQAKAQFIKHLVRIDDGVAEIGEWILFEESRQILHALRSLNDTTMDERCRVFREHEIVLSLRFLSHLASPSCLQSWLVDVIANHREMTQFLIQIMVHCLDYNVSCEAMSRLGQLLFSQSSSFDPRLRYILAIGQLRTVRGLENLKSMTDMIAMALEVLHGLHVDFIDVRRLTSEVGQTLAEIVSSDNIIESLDEGGSETLLLLLDWVTGLSLPDSTTLMIPNSSFAQLCTCMEQVLSLEKKALLESVQSRIMFDSRDSSLPCTTTLVESFRLSIDDLETLLNPPTPMPSTPRKNTPDLLSLVTISPPTAVLRSPAATGLTKTYSNNDFRQLRQLPSARQNTSRLPSMHVDDFESSPLLVPVSMPEVFLGLSPTFHTT